MGSRPIWWEGFLGKNKMYSCKRYGMYYVVCHLVQCSFYILNYTSL